MKREASYYIAMYVVIYINDFKFCSFKKQKIKLSRDQKSKNYPNKLEIKKYGNKLMMKLNSWYRLKVHSKAFAIPILTAIILSSYSSMHYKGKCSQNKDSNALELNFDL